MPVFDAVSTATQSTGTSRTWSHSPVAAAADGILLVHGWVDSVSDVVTAVTYNGTTPNETHKDNTGIGQGWIYLWRFNQPANGAHDIIITCSGSVPIAGCGVSLTDASQGNLSVVNGGVSSSATDFILSVDTLVNNCYVGMFAMNSLEAPTVPANNTARTLSEKRATATEWTGIVATPTQVYPKFITTSAAAWQAYAFAVAPFGGGGGSAARAMHSYRQRR